MAQLIIKEKNLNFLSENFNARNKNLFCRVYLVDFFVQLLMLNAIIPLWIKLHDYIGKSCEFLNVKQGYVIFDPPDTCSLS